MRPTFLNAPNLNTNLNTNSSALRFGQVLMNDAQRGLGLNEQKRQNQANNTFRDNSLSQSQANSDRTYALKLGEINRNNEQRDAKLQANTEVLKATRPDVYANIGQEYGSIPSVDNANKMNAVTGNIDINSIKSPTLKTFNGMSNGKPTVYTIDNNGNTNNTGIEVFQKPSEVDRLMGVLTGNNNPTKQAQVADIPSTANNIVPTPTGGIKTENKPISNLDIVTKDQEIKITDADGRVWSRNPITKREYLVKDVKPKEINLKDVEGLNDAVGVLNNLQYAKDNYKPDYTGPLDDVANKARNFLGKFNTPEDGKKYNEWTAALQSVANKARNKSFGAALSSFDIEEFAKEFPSTSANDSEVLPKLDKRTNMLRDSIKNTYNAWVDKYGKERTDKYFQGLKDKMFLDNNVNKNANDNISDEDLLKAIRGQ